MEDSSALSAHARKEQSNEDFFPSNAINLDNNGNQFIMKENQESSQAPIFESSHGNKSFMLVDKEATVLK